jgi:hypothetical protein
MNSTMESPKIYRGKVYLWAYIPSGVAAVVFGGIFLLLTAAIAWRLWRTRTLFCLPFAIGGVRESSLPLSVLFTLETCVTRIFLSPLTTDVAVEVCGYATRAAVGFPNATDSLGLNITQGAFLLLPPVLFAATLYMVYSRLVRALDAASLSLLSPRRTTVLFVTGDCLCLTIQGDAAGLLAKPNLARIADDIIVAGLVLQVVLFVAFMICCVIFHLRFHAQGRHANFDSSTHAALLPWRATLYMLYGTSLAILVRNLYRVVEFAAGQDGYLFKNEWPTYAFDGALMVLVMLGFVIWYPGKLVVATRESFEMRLNSGASSDRTRLHAGQNGAAAGRHTLGIMK